MPILETVCSDAAARAYALGVDDGARAAIMGGTALGLLAVLIYIGVEYWMGRPWTR